MQRTLMPPDATCVGDVRLAPLDVGFDVRLHGYCVDLPDEFNSVGFEEEGHVYRVTGTRSEMVEALRNAGYTVKVGDRDPDNRFKVRLRCKAWSWDSVRWNHVTVTRGGVVRVWREEGRCYTVEHHLSRHMLKKVWRLWEEWLKTQPLQ